VGLLFVGRFLAGVASGAMFAAGTAWVKELSVAPYDPDGTEQSGARRAAVALSLGFGLGPIVAGLLAQWGPDPLVLPYVPHLAVMTASLLLLRGAPETVGDAAWRWAERGRRRVSVRQLARPRFVHVVVPFAPWVFAAPAIAFAFLPGAIGDHPHGDTVAFASAVACPEDLASLTAVYYAFTYVGFAAPIVLAELAPVASYQTLLAAAAGLGALTLLLVVVQARRYPLVRV